MRLLTGEPTTARTRRTRSTTSRRSYRRRKGAPLEFNVDHQVAREIFAVVYLSLALLVTLSIYGKLGKVGEFLNGGLEPFFGFGINLLPFVFFGISLGLLFAKKSPFSLSKITGVILFFGALLSIFHLSVPESDLLSAAQRGEYGGYIGFVLNFFFRSFLQIGNLGASIVFVSTFIVGLLLTFEFSIVDFLRKAKPEIRLERRRSQHDDDEAVDAVDAEFDEIEDAQINIIKPRTMLPGKVVEEGSSGASAEITEPTEPVVRHRPPPQPVASDDDTTQPVMGTQDVSPWEFPPLDLLDPPARAESLDEEGLKKNAEIIRKKLEQFGIDVVMSDVHVGPTVVQYSLKPHEGVKLSKITALKSDLALALAAEAIRIEAPIPGKSLVGIELPNAQRTTVSLREILESPQWKESKSNLRLPLGHDVSGSAVVVDLSKMPHMLIAGATGAGKSVGMNSFLTALLYQNSPNDLKLLMVDPKRVELNTYNGIPHLLTPVITDVEKAATALRWTVAEMNRRYSVLAEVGHRKIDDYNEDSTIRVKMPKIVVVIDELADLMMAAGKDVEASICRIAQMARAVGIHLIIATQRPSVDVITGLIKANIPARVSYAVTSGIDSRTILDSIGAEDLLGQGDMLFVSGQMSKPVRVQGVYISSKEIERVTNRVKITLEPEYDESITSMDVAKSSVHGLPSTKVGTGGGDPFYEKALAVVVDSRKASASLLQRRLEIGYARAARILDEMEENGVIGPVRGAKPREIYIQQVEEAPVE